MKAQQSPLRLRKKHGSGMRSDRTAADGGRLVSAQSLRGAVVAGLVVIIVFSMFWVAVTSLLNQVLPWMTVLLGPFLGIAIRRAGRGVDARFPLLAAVLAILGSFLANVVIAASNAAESLDAGTLEILLGVTNLTWPVFFDEVLNAADAFYAVFAAALAAFFANRRLSRSQYYALRLWREEQEND